MPGDGRHRRGGFTTTTNRAMRPPLVPRISARSRKQHCKCGGTGPKRSLSAGHSGWPLPFSELPGALAAQDHIRHQHADEIQHDHRRHENQASSSRPAWE